MKSTIRFIRLRCVFAAIIATAIFAGCSDDDSESAGQGYGFVQFRLYKNGSYNFDTAVADIAPTRASDRLEYLHEAAKIKVTLRSADNDILAQTVTVTAANNSLAEWGMQSDKFQLTAGAYTILGYEIYDALDNSILAGEPDETTSITVIAGGLVSQDIVVNVVERGWVKFQLTKDNSELPQTRTGQDGADAYPFHAIMFADVTVQHQTTNETTTFEGLKMTHEFVRDENVSEGYHTSACKTDSVVSLKSGLYKVVSFRTYFDYNKKIYETSEDVNAPEFSIRDNLTTETSVPVTLHVTSGHIADAITLRKIWEALDGPNWESPVTWDFNRDVDLWTAQRGVHILENGRIALLNFEGTGARGAMPAAIGDLTELRQLYLGTHTYVPGSTQQTSSNKLMELEKTDRKAFRRSFHETFFRNGDQYSGFSEEMQLSLELGNISRKKSSEKLRALPGENDPVNYSNNITSLPTEINSLRKLETLYIAFCPMESLPDDMSGLESLTDVELFGCPRMTTFPKGLATLPSLIGLTFAVNYNVEAGAMEEGLQALNAGPAGKTLQTLYLPNQKIDVLPDLSDMIQLAVLNVQNCGITSISAPFGKEHPFVTLLASNNKLTTLPVDGDGYFVGLSAETEELNFSNNAFTELPDIFSAKSIFRLGTVDFSFNKIDRIGTFNGPYRGIHVEIFNLNGNNFSKFPRELYPSGSSIAYMQLQGNGIEEIEKEALTGENIYMTTAFDLSFNKLTKLPNEFNNRTFSYLQGLDLSFNRFEAFPFGAVNNQYLNTFIFRHQRDASGDRCMREWPDGIGRGLAGLHALYLGSNDLRKVSDDLSYQIYNLDISDNPNILIDVSAICPYIKAGMFNLIYSPDQDIRGCDALILDK